MKSIWRFFSLFFLFCWLGSEAAAQNNNTIHGKVRSANGVSVNNAIVELWQFGALLSQTATRTEGDFYFTNLAPTEYEVIVTATGYETVSQIARFTQPNRSPIGDLLNIEVLLRPKAEPKQPPASVSFVQEVPKAARLAYEDGIEKLRLGKADDGLLALRKAVEIFAEYFDANFALARELFRTGKDQEALEAIERARLVNDREAAVYHLFGLIMLRQGKYAAADYGFRGAINLNANLIGAHFYRGQTLIEIATRTQDEKKRDGYFAEAEAELNKAWDLSNKRMSDVYLQRARLYKLRGDKEASAKALEAYLKAEPKAPNAAQIKQAIDDLRKK